MEENYINKNLLKIEKQYLVKNDGLERKIGKEVNRFPSTNHPYVPKYDQLNQSETRNYNN